MISFVGASEWQLLRVDPRLANPMFHRPRQCREEAAVPSRCDGECPSRVGQLLHFELQDLAPANKITLRVD